MRRSMSWPLCGVSMLSWSWDTSKCRPSFAFPLTFQCLLTASHPSLQVLGSCRCSPTTCMCSTTTEDELLRWDGDCSEQSAQKSSSMVDVCRPRGRIWDGKYVFYTRDSELELSGLFLALAIFVLSKSYFISSWLRWSSCPLPLFWRRSYNHRKTS